MYTIGEVAQMLNLSVSTLRYYDKEGLLPNIQRENGIRKFNEENINTLRVIECLKKSGLEIKEIRQFIEWANQGSKTYTQRLNLFEHTRDHIVKQIQELNDTLEMVNYKCWYYTNAIKDGNEDRVKLTNFDQYKKNKEIS